MKIDNNSKSSSPISGDAKTRASRETPAAGTAAGPASSARVQLSSLASGLQQLEQLVASSPVVDSNKVDEIKQAISQGQFEVHADKVADGLIESVRQMLAAQPRAA